MQCRLSNDGIPGTRDFCDAATGDCQNVSQPGWNGCASDTDCDDGSACTNDSCLGGGCIHVLLNCDDMLYCTVDSCNPLSGCVYTPDPACTVVSCENGNEDCDDNDECTTDACDIGTGYCIHSVDPFCGVTTCTVDNDCQDGLTCTWDRCFNGVCRTEPVLCNDGLACTQQYAEGVEGGTTEGPQPDCVEGIGCRLDPDLECTAQCLTDADCDTGAPCFVGTCNAGICQVAGKPCNDDDPCTFDFCNPVTGQCATSPVPTCDDTGCTEPVNEEDDPIGCDDGDLCTEAVCVSGRCAFTNLKCNDFVRAVDSCDPESGCVFTQILLWWLYERSAV